LQQNQLSFLFLHGAGGSAKKWGKVSQLLGDLPAKILDLPGHGNDQSHTVPTSIEEYANLLNQHITGDTIVVGHSMGGLIGLELAAINVRVKGLILACSHPRLSVHPKILEQLAQGVFPENFFRASYAKNAPVELLEEEREELYRTPIATALVDFQSCDRYVNGAKALAELRIPILAIYGKQDKLLPADAREQLLSIRPDVQWESISDAGHYAIVEKYEEFTALIKRFWANTVTNLK